MTEERALKDLMQMRRPILDKVAEEAQCGLTVRALDEETIQRSKELLSLDQ